MKGRNGGAAHVETLVAFAAGRGQTTKCATCRLDIAVRNEIAGTREELGISWPIVSAWLAEKRGVTIKPNALRNHFVEGHDKEAS